MIDGTEELASAAWDAYNVYAFIAGYEACADGDEIGDDEGTDPIGWHAETIQRFADDCHEFASANVLDLVASGLDPYRAGCDFWLTRNGYGAGFWDEGYRAGAEANQALTRLTDASHAYGSCELYVGDDGWIYAS